MQLKNFYLLYSQHVSATVGHHQVFFFFKFLRRADPPPKESYRMCKNDRETEEKRQSPNKGL
jgi:hypothetical protein